MKTLSFEPDMIKSLTRALVIGAGKTGISCAKLLKKQGKKVIVNDIKKGDELSNATQFLENLGVPYIFGEHPESLLSEVDFVIVSPGISPKIPILEEARNRGIPVLGEFEYAWYFADSPVIAVTGTNGKTTVTCWINHTLKELGFNTALAGNNDTPLSDIVAEPVAYDWIVAELSSYQLEYTHFFHPRVAAVLNVTPDHISRHPTLQEYADTKCKIFQNQTEQDAAVINSDDEWVSKMNMPPSVKKLCFSLETEVQGAWVKPDGEESYILFNKDILGKVSQIPLKGKHNLANALAVLTIVSSLSIPPEKVYKAMNSFKGVPHRIEFLGSKNGVAFYNDSKSTNVESLRVALESFQQSVILIAGGRGKGASYKPLRQLVQEKVCFLITLGEDAQKIEDAFSDLVQVERVQSMEEAVKVAWQHSLPGSAILLSPACASFDMYPNFEIRGEHFRKCVKQLLAEE
ncbi:MAG TPA: UDP-N-acetylmuramoyl-L-alanine--D-glutamate ligase [Candidatus Hydrogenedens sp.]|nr:UDP-N-acetylmuramoyl-L-alanine--D-glutamate ligase [Candidatus Hydrogenedens sp.]